MTFIMRTEQEFNKEPEYNDMTHPEERQRGIEYLVEHLSDYEFAEELMIDAARHAITNSAWIDMTPEERIEVKREIYKHLKVVSNVKLLDDKLTREDIGELRIALQHLKNAILEISQDLSTTGAALAAEEINSAIIHVEKAMEQ